jgi:hypothetical protein
MTGLTIEHFVRVSMVGFYDTAQALGQSNVPELSRLWDATARAG